MPQPYITTPANLDLLDIWERIAANDPETADEVIDSLERRFRLLAEYPMLGRESEYGINLRCFSVPPYIIFYRPAEDGVHIIRVSHGRRDMDELFQTD